MLLRQSAWNKCHSVCLPADRLKWAESLVLPTDEIHSAVTQEERSTKDRDPRESWPVFPHNILRSSCMLFSFTYIPPWQTDWYLVGCRKCSTDCSCVLAVSSLPDDRLAVWMLIWLRKHAAGPSVSQHKERTDEAPCEQSVVDGATLSWVREMGSSPPF